MSLGTVPRNIEIKDGEDDDIPERPVDDSNRVFDLVSPIEGQMLEQVLF